jgi:hypothetical protein
VGGAVVLVAAVSLGSGVVLAGSAVADPTIGPTPAPAAKTSVTFTTPTDGLVNGQQVGFTVNTTAPTTLNKVESKICATGYTTYGEITFGYGNIFGNIGATRCVYGPGITDGGLASIQPNYRVGPIPYYRVETSGR